MSNNAEVVFTGNAKGLLDEYKKLEKANEQLSQKLLAAMKVSKQAANEEKKLRQEVTQAIEKSKSPAEAYIATINRYKQALQSGMITAEQFYRIRDVELSKLNASKAALNGKTDAVRKNTDALRQNARGSDEALTSISSMATSFVSITAVIAAATSALRGFSDEQKRMQDAAAGTVTGLDEMSRDYAVQAGLATNEQRLSARSKILEMARKNSATKEMAFSTAAQLASSGFTDTEGGTLNVGLQALMSSDMKGDGGAFIDSSAQFLTAYQKPMDEENLKKISVGLRGLYATPVKASDLAGFAPAAGPLAMKKVPMETGLAMLSILRETMSGSEAGTAMKNITLKSANFSKDAVAKKALKELGLKPEDVDATGETMPEVIKRLKTAIFAQPEEKQLPYATALFDSYTASAAISLMSNVDKIAKYEKDITDPTSYNTGVMFSQQGEAASQRRDKIVTMQEQIKAEEQVTRIEQVRRFEDLEYERQYSQATKRGDRSTQFGLYIQRKALGMESFFKGPRTEPYDQSLIAPDANGVIPSDAERAARNRQRFNEYQQSSTASPQAGAGGADPVVEAINRQTSVLSGKLTPPAKPTVNPNLQGRP